MCSTDDTKLLISKGTARRCLRVRVRVRVKVKIRARLNSIIDAFQAMAYLCKYVIMAHLTLEQTKSIFALAFVKCKNQDKSEI